MTNEINSAQTNNPIEKEEKIWRTDVNSEAATKTETAPPKTKTYQLPESASTMQVVDALLKAPESVVHQIKAGQFKKTLFILLSIFILCHAIYGLIVGSFSGNVQWFAAPIKIVGGAILSGLLCYPSLYIFACLSGTNVTPSQILALLVGGLTLTSILLLGFAPVAFIFTFSIQTVAFMGLVHMLIWGVSIYFGLSYIIAGLVRLGSRQDTRFIKTWCAILILTLLQMTTTLRPIIGESDTFLTHEKRFFMVHWLDSLKNSKY
jgi:hypothetical protein